MWRFLSGLAFSLVALAVPAVADGLRAGVDYIELQPPRPVRVEAGKIEVREFFNYACPHCFRMQGYFTKWQAEHAGEDVVVVHQPLIFARYNGHFARVYYTLSGLNLADSLHAKVYDTIHVQRELINSEGRFLDWLEEQGVARDNAEAMYDSFTVNSLATRAETIAADYGINSTPQISINGKYVINPALSRSYEQLMETLTALVERERRAQQ